MRHARAGVSVVLFLRQFGAVAQNERFYEIRRMGKQCVDLAGNARAHAVQRPRGGKAARLKRRFLGKRAGHNPIPPQIQREILGRIEPQPRICAHKIPDAHSGNRFFLRR